MANRKSSKKSQTKKARTKPSYPVFVSQATTDKWIATTFCEKIDAVGVTFGSPTYIKPNFRHKPTLAIHGSNRTGNRVIELSLEIP